MAVARKTRIDSSFEGVLENIPNAFEVKIIPEKQSRVEILQAISNMTDLKRIDVEAVFDATYALISGHMREGGSGEFIIPKLGVKMKKVRKKERKERKMVSPLTGTEVEIAGRPAIDDVKLIALKPVKETVRSAEENAKSSEDE